MPKLEQFGVILYTLRDFVKTREDALATFDKVSEIGYKSVQVSGLSADLFSEEELVDTLGERGLSICATHESGDEILHQTEKVIDRLKKLGTRYTAYPFPAGIDFSNEESMDGLITGLNEAGRKMADAGLVLCYHNHHHEFQLSRGKTILQRIYEETDPRFLQAEIDTFWVQRGGGSPVGWLRSLKGRSPLLHMKDYRLKPESLDADYAEIGNGNMDFVEIVKAAEAAGCEHYIVEQDTCPGDPFDSLSQSFEYIRDNLVW
ncbi:sugar phosphate isomerase/epimerase [Pelagicoccus sp. SDUM812002]|uniref:sugar phosphate isomerase/epimerase family protein n=1 Tax=Pelagicoccus sp. SDUM812002 TaxID=3041266 RepID=UPI00280E6C88|nr:sugar phosphate isomerase/epimerase [Pelagicoccus sp. SDUM812002]MDQ8188379.1 sugar phosphate isomerase/epimerase [Pelagicoccus sp. SDUM812002]